MLLAQLCSYTPKLVIPLQVFWPWELASLRLEVLGSCSRPWWLAELPPGAARWHWCGFWCALTQSLGTVLFNVETLSAWLGPGLDASAQFWLELLPNLLGSILFLISAAYAFLEIGHGRLVSIEPGHLGWWIAVVNGLGCVWFMQSALTPPVDADAAIRATLIGAVAFTVVGLLSLAECSGEV